ncbi:zinc finger MYM-type protein 1-like [Homarus americanus]|uniref:zinc finger MYM-type protein 1-like n=1 Tax=Homarus americanus TaxID=6706 RepID=UPI001C45EC28|nr:zinc finger MYM-type protein 1-like [Homarus americanus]
MQSQEEQSSACACTVCDLLKNSFRSRDFTIKKVIVENGRHIPKLSISLKVKNCVRKFNNQMYMINDWLAGCSSAQRVYCWACLLFSNDKNVWNTYGYNDLSNVHKAVKKHSLSESYLQAVISEKTFGKARIDYMLSDQKRVRDNQHNQLVKRNREIMKRYIDTVCYLAKTEQAFRGHDEATSSVNKGNYVEFIDVLSKYDGQLRGFLDNATTFSGLSNLIQNDLIESVSYVMLDEIKKEIQHAKFISVMLDEATDITNLCQLSYVFRYSLDNKVYERFLGFENVSQDRTAEALYTFVTNFMQKYECDSQIVAQTYDGAGAAAAAAAAAVMAGELNGLQSRVKGKYPTALFIHCFAHRLNLVLSQAMAKISKFKVNDHEKTSESVSHSLELCIKNS